MDPKDAFNEILKVVYKVKADHFEHAKLEQCLVVIRKAILSGENKPPEVEEKKE